MEPILCSAGAPTKGLNIYIVEMDCMEMPPSSYFSRKIFQLR